MVGQLIRVRGIVQGVGFRPTVARLARARGLRGWVRNDADGVLIGLAEPEPGCAAFVDALLSELPPLARVDAVERAAGEVAWETGFAIVASVTGPVRTAIGPDAATCLACLEEVGDPAGRRFRYPFTTCTHCGPRLTIACALPYDRANTTMAGFALCPDCAAEYGDETNRRHHAEPIACPVCGPRATLLKADGTLASDPEAFDNVEAAGRVLALGGIVALKGLGGYQLLCDATDAVAVARLRQRKHRPDRPFAVLARDVSQVRRYAVLDPNEEKALRSSAGPILILPALPGTGLAAGIAPGQRTVGFLLPTTPLHHLLAAQLDRPLVCTSGNVVDEPQATDDDDARVRVGGIADVFLTHDRPIRIRVDDSVARTLDGEVRILRRARGYAPAPLALPPGLRGGPAVLACGAHLKATVCLAAEGRAVLSPHVGDLDDARTFESWCDHLALLSRLCGHVPAAVAVNLHPGYASTAFGRSFASDRGLPVVAVQHHHAHVASVLAEHGVPRGADPVLGLAFDGLGLGSDGGLWGGELLVADYTTAVRVASFQPVPLLGGDRAAREPWRNLYAQLRHAGYDLERWAAHPVVARMIGRSTPVLEGVAASEALSPPCSAVGRLFDAAAATVGLWADRTTYEGQAAIALEALVDPDALAWARGADPYPFAVASHGGLPVISSGEALAAMLDDVLAGVPAPRVAGRFHVALARQVAALAEQVRAPGMTTAALSGGVWQNRILVELVAELLREQDWTVLLHRHVPPNDGGIAFGQAAVAAAALTPDA